MILLVIIIDLGAPKKQPKPSQPVNQGNLLDFDLMGSMGTSNPVRQENLQNSKSGANTGGFGDLEMDLMGQFPPITPQLTLSESLKLTPSQDTVPQELLGFDSFPVQTHQIQSGGFDIDILGGVTGTAATPTISGSSFTPTPVPSKVHDEFEFDEFQAPVSAGLVITAFKDQSIEVRFTCRKDDFNPSKTLIDIMFDNLGNQQITGLDVKISPAKHLNLQAFNPLGIYALNPGARDLKTHQLEVVNKEHGTKAIAFKMLVTYNQGGMPRTAENLVTGFQPNY